MDLLGKLRKGLMYEMVDVGSGVESSYPNPLSDSTGLSFSEK